MADPHQSGHRESAEHFEAVADLDNELEAQLLASILTERDVPHLIVSFQVSAYVGLFASHGWGRVDAPPRCAEEIREVLAELRTS